MSRNTRPVKHPVTVRHTGHTSSVSGLLIGYARFSTDAQDLTALADLGVPAERVYVDHGLTGTHCDRPGLHEALAACRGDTIVAIRLDRLARSLPDARDIVDDLTRRQVKLNLGSSLHDSTDPVGRLLFNVLAMVAEFGQRLTLEPALELRRGHHDIAELLHPGRPYLSLRRKPATRPSRTRLVAVPGLRAATKKH